MADNDPYLLRLLTTHVEQTAEALRLAQQAQARYRDVVPGDADALDAAIASLEVKANALRAQIGLPPVAAVH